MRRGKGGTTTAASVKLADKDAIVSNNDEHNKDDHYNCKKDNGDKDIDVVNVVGRSPKKWQTLLLLFPTLEARRRSKDTKRI